MSELEELWKEERAKRAEIESEVKTALGPNADAAAEAEELIEIGWRPNTTMTPAPQ